MEKFNLQLFAEEASLSGEDASENENAEILTDEEAADEAEDGVEEKESDAFESEKNFDKDEVFLEPHKNPEPRHETNEGEIALLAAREHFADKQCDAWLSEAQALEREYEDFDLSREMKNPTFRSGLRLGMDMKALYLALHYDSVREHIARSAALYAAENVRKSLSRPNEIGTRGPCAAVRRADVMSLTDDEMDAIATRIAKGERISFS